MRRIESRLLHRDHLIIEWDESNLSAPSRISGVACSECREMIAQYTKQYGDFKSWPLPTENSHSALQIKELILKSKDQWNPPYTHVEICHCRAITTEIVESAIVAGAHQIDQVRRWTSAGTACGTCSTDLVAMIKFRLSPCDPQ